MLGGKKERLWQSEYYPESRVNYNISPLKNIKAKLMRQSIAALVVFVIVLGVLHGEIGNEHSYEMVMAWIAEDDVLAEGVTFLQIGADLLNREIQAAIGDNLANNAEHGEMPLSGRIISNYGWQKDEGKFNKGIIIEADEVEAVRAYADGVVQAIKPEGEYYTLILAHSDGVVSIYGNCATVIAEEKRSVKKGEIIAYSGLCTVTKSRLYFELEHNGEPLEPFGYLPDKSV